MFRVEMEGVLEEEGSVECEDGAKMGSAEAEGNEGREARRLRKQELTRRDPYTLPVRRRASQPRSQPQSNGSGSGCHSRSRKGILKSSGNIS